MSSRLTNVELVSNALCDIRDALETLAKYNGSGQDLMDCIELLEMACSSLEEIQV